MMESFLIAQVLRLQCVQVKPEYAGQKFDEKKPAYVEALLDLTTRKGQMTLNSYIQGGYYLSSYKTDSLMIMDKYIIFSLGDPKNFTVSLKGYPFFMKAGWVSAFNLDDSNFAFSCQAQF